MLGNKSKNWHIVRIVGSILETNISPQVSVVLQRNLTSGFRLRNKS